MKNTNRQSYLPNRIIISLLIGWLFFFTLFAWIIFINFYPDPPVIFPISVIYKSTVNYSSIVPVICLLGVLLLITKKPIKYLFAVYIISFSIIILGNLIQGGFNQGFLAPLGIGSDRQPLYDATHGQILNGGFTFLDQFNEIQNTLSNHARTHPPFLILFWNILGRIHGSESVSIGSILVVSLIFPVFFSTLRLLQFSPERAAKFTFLMALIPAINIYSILTWDSIAAFGYFLFLWGLVSIYQQGLKWFNLLLLSIGFIFANMFNFLSMGLGGMIILISLWQIIHLRRYSFLIATLLLGVISIFVFIIWKNYFGYDHIISFINSINLEKERIVDYSFNEILKIYTFSRLEGISEILLFLFLRCSRSIIVSPIQKNCDGFR